MGLNQETIEKMYWQGLESEFFVMEKLKEQFGGECAKATKKEDIFAHIDFWWFKSENEKIGIDVKGLRKNKRTDKNNDDTITWIEFLNVHGKLGWLYGKSDFIAFCTLKDIIFVNTKKLREYAEAKIENKELVFDTPKEFYIPYQRKKYGRKDKTMKVPISDLYDIADFTVNI